MGTAKALLHRKWVSERISGRICRKDRITWWRSKINKNEQKNKYFLRSFPRSVRNSLWICWIKCEVRKSWRSCSTILQPHGRRWVLLRFSTSKAVSHSPSFSIFFYIIEVLMRCWSQRYTLSRLILPKLPFCDPYFGNVGRGYLIRDLCQALLMQTAPL